MALEDALNEELTKVLGVSANWQLMITNVIRNRADMWVNHNNGLLEDVSADVVGDIIIHARDGTLSKAIIRAKDASKTEEELVANLRKVVLKAAFYRVSDAMRWRYRPGAVQFSQISDENDFSESVQARQEFEEFEDEQIDYSKLLMEELELMAVAIEWRNKYKVAKRYRLAKEMVPDRLAGMKMRDLMEKYDIGSKGSFQLILDDIGQALARIAGRLGDPTLIRGTADIEIA